MENGYDPAKLAARVRILRAERGMNRSRFGRELCGTSSGLVKHWEAGRNAPTAYFLFRLAQACGVSADWLLGLTDERR